MLIAGSLLLATSPMSEPLKFLHCAALALLTSTFKVRLPGTRSSVSTSFVLFLVAISQLSFAEALLLTIPATLLQCVWKTRKWPTAAQMIFNVTATLVNTSIAALVYSAVIRAGSPVPALVMAATSFFFVGSLLVSGIISITQSAPFGRIWLQCDRWALPYYVGGAILAVLVGAYAQLQGLHLALAMLTGLLLLYVWYQNRVSAVAESQT